MLYQLQKSLDDHVTNFGSSGMLRYYVNLIPEKCDPQFQFLEKDNMVFGCVHTGHQSEVFDKTLLDSSISFPCEKKYLKYAQKYLARQISVARNNRDVKTLELACLMETSS